MCVCVCVYIVSVIDEQFLQFKEDSNRKCRHEPPRTGSQRTVWSKISGGDRRWRTANCRRSHRPLPLSGTLPRQRGSTRNRVRRRVGPTADAGVLYGDARPGRRRRRRQRTSVWHRLDVDGLQQRSGAAVRRQQCWRHHWRWGRRSRDRVVSNRIAARLRRREGRSRIDDLRLSA